MSVAISISAQSYRVDLGTEFIVGTDSALFQLFVKGSMLTKSVDNFTVGIDVVYLANGRFADRKSTRLNSSHG